MKKQKKNCLFFDIETTGLAADISAIVVIGCRTSEGDCIQWFNKDGFSQKDILKDFLNYCTDWDQLVSFNGATFDLPFLQTKIKEYGLSDSLSEKEHLDLYKELRPYRHLFPLSRFRQKDLETFLGIHRKDTLSGRKVIKAYQSWIASGDTRWKEQVLLHNREDLDGLAAVSDLLCYPALESGDFSIQKALISHSSFQAELLLNQPFPKAARFEKDGLSLEINEELAILEEPLQEGMLKHYYPNPKDYYYLPKEDIIIPKSMKSFVDASSRIPASPSNCYSKFKPEHDFFEDSASMQTLLVHNIHYLLKK